MERKREKRVRLGGNSTSISWTFQESERVKVTTMPETKIYIGDGPGKLGHHWEMWTKWYKISKEEKTDNC